MSEDDANDSGPGECPGHEFVLADLAQVQTGDAVVPGFALVHECRYCGAVDYEPSAQDDPHRGRIS